MTAGAVFPDELDQRMATIHPSILLASGRYFSFLEPTPLTISEVAHALSNLCRFTGHCSSFYSVAQHSVHVSRLVPPELARQGLLHDAAEAVIGDMASPLKKLFPAYKALEQRCEQTIFAGFNLPAVIDPRVKHADLVALRTEQRDFMSKNGGLWTFLDGIEPDADTLMALSPDMAFNLFMRRAQELQLSMGNGRLLTAGGR